MKRIISSLALCLVLSGCVTGSGAKWYAPTTWFSHHAANVAEAAQTKEVKAEANASRAEDKATHTAHVEFFKANLAALASPDSKPVALARRTLGNGLGLLDQFDPLTAAESADGRQIVADLLSESAARATAAEAKQQTAETELSRVSRELVETQTNLAATKQARAAAEAKLLTAYDRENELANELRSQHALFWIAVAAVVLLSGLALYLRMGLGSVGAALHFLPPAIQSQVVPALDGATDWLHQTIIAAGRAKAQQLAAKAQSILGVSTPAAPTQPTNP